MKVHRKKEKVYQFRTQEKKLNLFVAILKTINKTPQIVFNDVMDKIINGLGGEGLHPELVKVYLDEKREILIEQHAALDRIEEWYERNKYRSPTLSEIKSIESETPP